LKPRCHFEIMLNCDNFSNIHILLALDLSILLCIYVCMIIAFVNFQEIKEISIYLLFNWIIYDIYIWYKNNTVNNAKQE